ncbi:hypothetical protein Trydic_g15642 [Trypoxylus dichotomus]
MRGCRADEQTGGVDGGGGVRAGVTWVRHEAVIRLPEWGRVGGAGSRVAVWGIVRLGDGRVGLTCSRDRLPLRNESKRKKSPFRIGD